MRGEYACEAFRMEEDLSHRPDWAGNHQSSGWFELIHSVFLITAQ